MTEQNERALAVRAEIVPTHNKNTNLPAIQRGQAGAAAYVQHLTPGEVKLMALMAGRNKRHGERNGLLIKVIFDATLRVSEALGIRPVDLQRTSDGWTLAVLGKGNKPGLVAVSSGTAAELQAYCYRRKIGEGDKVFPITRSQAFRVVQSAYDQAGVRRPTRDIDRVGAVHVLRHSGAIERLRQTGNPKAVQDQLRHSSAMMTLRYLKTISRDESLKIQSQVDPFSNE